MSLDDTMTMAGAKLRVARGTANVKGRGRILLLLACLLNALGCVENAARQDRSPPGAPPLAEPWLDARFVPESFYLEDDRNGPIPPAAREVILKSARDPYLNECEFVGRYADLGAVGRAEDLIVSTAGACGWGNAMGPLWVLRKEGTTYRVLLFDSGYELSFLPHRSKGLPAIKVSASAAAWYEERRWRFGGKRYKKTMGFYVDKGNSEDCRRHPEVCD